MRWGSLEQVRQRPKREANREGKKKRSSFTLYGQKIWGELWPVHACENVPLDPAQARTKRVKNLHSNSITSSVFFFAKRRRRERETNGENVCLRLHVLFSLLSGRSLCIPTIYLYSPSSSSNSKTPQISIVCRVNWPIWALRLVNGRTMRDQQIVCDATERMDASTKLSGLTKWLIRPISFTCGAQPAGGEELCPPWTFSRE